MRLVTFQVPTPVGPATRIGALVDADTVVIDLTSGYARLLQEQGEGRAREAAEALVPPDMVGFLEGGPNALVRGRQVLEFVGDRRDLVGTEGEQLTFQRTAVRLLAPVPRPRTIRDYSTFEEHMSTRHPRKPPSFYWAATGYKGNPNAVRGPEDPILYPAYTDWLDPELELGAVIFRRGRNIPVSDGAEYVAGYTIFVDVSARDLGPKEYLGPYKMKDFCTLLGPCLVTSDEFDERHAGCGIRVNGETWFEGNLGQARHYYTPELVAYASDGEDLVPGDVLGSGTVGTGCSMDINKWVQPGDGVELWIDGIGTISTSVVRETNGQSYVRHGLPGHLPIPEYARSFQEEFEEEGKKRLLAGPAGPGPQLRV